MPHEAFRTDRAPAPIGPYSQAIRISRPGSMMFVSGQIPIDPSTGTIELGPIEKQAELAFQNARNVIEDAGYSTDDVAKVTIFLTNLGDFEVVNRIYGERFVGSVPPARAVVQAAALPKGVGIEIEAIVVDRG